jgi:hypothetical protein
MSVTAHDGEAVHTALERTRKLPEPISEMTAEPPAAFPSGAPPASKPFRLHPEWAQRGPFW